MSTGDTVKKCYAAADKFLEDPKNASNLNPIYVMVGIQLRAFPNIMVNAEFVETAADKCAFMVREPFKDSDTDD